MPPVRFARPASAPSGVTVGNVYVAVVNDPWASETLGGIYRKLFETGGVRQGPDHFLYVQPSRARCEIRDLSRWCDAEFGPPGGRVPATTPFGYLSDRWDGWLALFSAVAVGREAALYADFMRSISPLSWANPMPATSPRMLRLAAPVVATEAPEKPAGSSRAAEPQSDVVAEDAAWNEAEAGAWGAAEVDVEVPPEPTPYVGGGARERERGYSQGLSVEDLRSKGKRTGSAPRRDDPRSGSSFNASEWDEPETEEESRSELSRVAARATERSALQARVDAAAAGERQRADRQRRFAPGDVVVDRSGAKFRVAERRAGKTGDARDDKLLVEPMEGGAAEIRGAAAFDVE